MSVFRVPVHHSDYVRTLKDPTGESSRRAVYALIRLADLPEFPLNPDPRVPKQGSTILRTIKDSAKSNDGNFHSKNRGITLCVKSVEFDNRTNHILLDMPTDSDDGLYGIIDGGHTQAAILKAVEEIKRTADAKEEVLPQQYVRLEIMVGIEEGLADIARARNFSAALKDWGLEGYRGKFKWLLEAIGDDAQHLRIKENEEQPVPIMDVIQVLCALNPKLYPHDKPAADAYTNVSKCLIAFVAEDDFWQFQKMKPICKDILNLYDYVRYHWDEKYNAADEAGQKGIVDARTEMKTRERNRKNLLTFYFLKSSGLFQEHPITKNGFPVEKGLALPLIAAFRTLIREDASGLYQWSCDPVKFFDEYGTAMVRAIMEASQNAKADAHRVGRDRSVYETLYRIAENAVLQSENKRLHEAMRQAGLTV